MMGLFMAIIGMGFLAFALDVGSLFRQKRMAQAAADAAAVAAAKEVFSGNSAANEQAMANAVAKLNGFDTTLSRNPATVTLTTPTAGAFTGSTYVQATVARSITTPFMASFSSRFATMRVTATAIAGGFSSPSCVCLESGTGEDLDLEDNATLNAPNCGVVDDSASNNAVFISSGATLAAGSLGTVSTTWENSSNISNGGTISSSTNIIKGITSSCAPTMPTPPTFVSSSCKPDPGNDGSAQAVAFTAGPASATESICYNGLTLGANDTIDTLSPGIYIINGGYLHFLSGAGSQPNYGGNGVFFYLANGAQVKIEAGANVNLVAGGNKTSTGQTAPSVGSGYDGILMYQSPTASSPNQIVITGGSTLFMNGALFAPSAQVTFSNGSGTTVEGGIVCSKLKVDGATLNANANVSEGTLTNGSPKLVQ